MVWLDDQPYNPGPYYGFDPAGVCDLERIDCAALPAQVNGGKPGEYVCPTGLLPDRSVPMDFPGDHVHADIWWRTDRILLLDRDRRLYPGLLDLDQVDLVVIFTSTIVAKPDTSDPSAVFLTKQPVVKRKQIW